jgi:monoamine oxidase
MYQYIRKKQGDDVFVFNAPVTSISSIDTDHAEVVAGGETYKFSSIICTIPLPVLRTLDLSKAGLSSMQKSALRDLNYGPSVKIGMQFRSAWWTTANDVSGNPLNIVGGQTYTDRPLRTTVYPSFGTSVQAGTTTTLIASYCWTEDAERLAALIANDQKALKEFTLNELARTHNVSYDFLRNQLIDWFPWSWSLDLHTMGISHLLVLAFDETNLDLRSVRLLWTWQV